MYIKDNWVKWRVRMNCVAIRMIFCDVDGTLLPHGSKSLSDDIFMTINRAVSSGIHFCIASGRSYPDLKRLFSPVINNVTFICNDGSLMVENESVLFSSPLDKSQIACMSKTYRNDYDALLIYTKDSTYYISHKIEIDFAKKVAPEDITFSVTGDIFKVAFMNLSQNANIKINNLCIKSGILNKVYEDATWTEYITAQTDKGTAAKILQRTYGVTPSETAAFGDNLNDLNMLRCAQYSYAPKTARPEIIRMCKFRTDNVKDEILNIISCK